MHPSRRKKKRPNYGIRTVEVARGPNGFGFTISGQQPCILSCIVKDSPADHAGLRAGDFLISVNDVSVSKTSHDAVVNRIGSCIDPIKMTIAENYYSDSSDEELDVNRIIACRKPKHKPRTNRNHRPDNRKIANSLSLMKSTGLHSVLKYSDGTKEALNPLNLSNNADDQAGSTEYKALVGYLGAIETPKQFGTDGRIKGLSLDDQGGPIEYKALVGYLGTIEMPNQLSPDTRLQTVCNCIRKLRQEKRSPTAVLMTVLPTCLTLKNASNHILAIYPTNRVVYVGSARDKDSRYFGLVTSAISSLAPKDNLDEWDQDINIKISNADVGISNSCHIFVTDPKLIDHTVHIRKAEAFNIMCSADPISGRCLEFPKDSLYIVSLIQSMYKLQCDVQSVKSNISEERSLPLLANSPQPSASSNSDSGIGFRDDFNAISDRIVLVEFPAKNLGNTSNCVKHQDASTFEEAPSNDGFQISPRDTTAANRFNFEFAKPNPSLKTVLNNEKPLNNVQNLKAYESVSIKNSFGGSKVENASKNNNEIEARLNNFTNSEKPTPRPTMDNLERNLSPSSFTSSDDNTKTSEGGIGSSAIFNNNDLNEQEAMNYEGCYLEMHKQCEVSYPDIHKRGDLKHQDVGQFDRHVNASHDYQHNQSAQLKRSVDDMSMSMCSSNGPEVGNAIGGVFKTPNAAFFDRKTRQVPQKLASSCDNLDRCGKNKKKLTPKRCGMTGPNYSYEELNNFDFGQQLGYGSLNDLFFANVACRKNQGIAKSEPDIRLRNRNGELRFVNENDSSVCKENGQENSAQAWAVSFEKLLEDPEGVKAFAEFLKKEFSSENIDFWVSVERFRLLPNGAEKKAEARRIYQQHVSVGAPEAVNVDAHVRQCAERALHDAPSDIFDKVQKQVLNLMKFDSYPRFLKSELYKQCLTNSTRSSLATPIKLKKSLSNAEDRRRKSLLPWHRKSRSKSKDRSENGEPVVSRMDESRCRNDIHSSRSSLTSLDLAFANNSQSQKDDADFINGTVLCRVSLGNCSTTVVQIKPSETVQEMVHRLLEKRGLNYSSFEVCTDRHSKPVDANEASVVLAGCEVRIQQRVVFKLDLPNRKTVAVKSKATKMIIDVLKPILHKYDFTVDQVHVVNPKDPGNLVDIRRPITTIDGLKLQVNLIDKKPMNGPEPRFTNALKTNKLVEITNQVFEGILQEKGETAQSKPKSEKGSVKSDDMGSEHSSSYFGKFLRRDSTQQEWKKKSLIPRSKFLTSTASSKSASTPEQNNLKNNKPLIAKLKAGVNKLQVSPYSETECNELVEGLTRAQKSRLEDQRGTEINYELPDFLKDKDKDRNLRKCSTEDGSFSTDNNQTSIDSAPPPTTPTRIVKPDPRSNYENQAVIPIVVDSSPLNTPSKQIKLNNERTYATKVNVDANEIVKSSQMSPKKAADSISPIGGREFRAGPPPLPPKPKIVPMRPPNWGHGNNRAEFRRPKEVGPSVQPKQPLFLEQPSSSFV